jgi:hypothetical protein
MQEVIDEGVTGLLAEPGDVESLRATLASLLAEPAKREAMGKAGRTRFLEYYTREKVTDRSEAFYRQVLTPKPLSPAAPAVLQDGSAGGYQSSPKTAIWSQKQDKVIPAAPLDGYTKVPCAQGS